MKALTTVVFVLVPLATAGLLLAADEPKPLRPTHAEVSYGPHAMNVLDFWQADGDGPRPLLVYIHGGGWTGGDKRQDPDRFQPFLENGISYASVNYRLTGQAPLPAPVHDAARAIQFIRSKAAEWNIDGSRIALCGGSAGACTSMWILLHDDLADPTAEDPVLGQSTRVSAAAVAGGQTSIDPKVIEPWLGPNVLQHRMINMAVGEQTIEAALANYEKHQALYEEFSPYNHLDADDPPLFMSYGSNMKLPSENAGHGIHHPVYGVKMKEKADELGHECHLVVPGVFESEKYTTATEFLMAKLLPAVAAESLEGSKPNIVLMITDDQGYGPVARHGHPWISTPNLDQLYDQSVRFTRFLVSPTCSPTRSALMTGRHPMKNGVTHTILERERMTLAATTLPQVLKQAGYATGIFGKWHLGDEEPYQPHRRGFDEAFIHGAGGIGQAYDCSCADAPGNMYFDPVIRHNGSFVKTSGFCTDIFFTAAMGWIKQVKGGDGPFFAYITTNAPHGPFIAPPKNTRRFTELEFGEQQAGFYGMIENIDENVGRLMDRLGQWQLLDNTLVIFMSDNGMTGGGSGRMGKPLGQLPNGVDLLPYNAGMKGLKGSADEGGVRVPLFVSWDGRIEPGRDIDRIAAHIDILPTLASLAGVDVPQGQVEGRNLLPLIQNPTSAWSDRFLFTHRGRWKTGEDPNDYQWKGFAVRNQRFRFVEDKALYDMEKDPGQTANVIDQHPEVVKKMRAAYDAWWKQARPLMVNESVPMSPTRPFHELYSKQMQSTGIPKWEAPSL